MVEPQLQRQVGKLPPGAMGLPLIGDTFEFFASHSLYKISPFISKRVARYGPLFRVGLFGQKMVVSTDPETNYSIFRKENQDLMSWHFGTVEEMVGEKLLTSHGSIHRYLRNLVLRMVGFEILKVKLLHEMDVATQRHLRSWATDGRVHVIDASQSYDESKQAKKLRENYKTFKDGLVSLPLNIPGTTFHACMQKQHEAILENRGSSENFDITWEEYKSMTFTHMVINETIRLSNIWYLEYSEK
ncbi:hypothetical protein Q3G72_008102 [Acer saccharum]|nr:hypothetical protein Q3G72_008102 [Acer saccharum]